MRWMILFLVACAATPKHVESRSAVDSLRATLGRAGIELRVATRKRTVDEGNCQLVGQAQLHLPKVDAMARAFAVYPTSALAVARVGYFAICSKLGNRSDDAAYGMTGLATHDTHGLLVDINHIHDPTLPWYDWIMGDSSAAELVHHEFFHHLEYAYDKTLGIEDREWDGLNLLGFVYHWANYEQALIPGFLDTYSMTKVSEDKATLYGNLMNNPRYVCDKARTDKVLRAKIGLLWRRIRAMTGTDSFLPPCILDPLIPSR